MTAAAIRRAANPSLSAIAPITVPKMTLLARNVFAQFDTASAWPPVPAHAPSPSADRVPSC
jgi:hypothetical protein